MSGEGTHESHLPLKKVCEGLKLPMYLLLLRLLLFFFVGLPCFWPLLVDVP